MYPSWRILRNTNAITLPQLVVPLCLRVIILPLGGALSTWLSRPQRCGLDNHVDNAPPSGKIITRRHHPITEGMTYGQQGDQYVCWECLTIAVAFREAPDQLVRHIAEQIELDLFRSE